MLNAVLLVGFCGIKRFPQYIYLDKIILLSLTNSNAVCMTSRLWVYNAIVQGLSIIRE